MVHDPISDMDFEFVIDESEIARCNLISYPYIDSAILLTSFRTQEGCKKNEGVTKQDTIDWIAFEKKQLSSIASEQSIPIHFLTDSENTGPDVLKHFMQNEIIVKEAAYDEGEVQALVI